VKMCLAVIHRTFAPSEPVKLEVIIIQYFHKCLSLLLVLRQMNPYHVIICS